MAETKRMTAEEVVRYLLDDEEGLDFLRESLTWVCGQLMEAEVSELVGVARGERAPEERLTHRNGYRPRHGRHAPASSSWRSRSCGVARTSPASSSRADARSRRWSLWCRRRMWPACRPGRSTRWSSRWG